MESSVVPDLSLLDGPTADLLTAICCSGSRAVDAYRRWRSVTTIIDANARSRRILPMVGDLLHREGIDDPDIKRIQGVSRHVWTQNTLNERLLLSAVDALLAAGIQSVLLKSVALFTRSPHLMGKRMSSDGDILVRPTDLPAAGAALMGVGIDLRGHHWDDLGPALIDSETSGVSFRQPDRRSEIDLHWRPLWNIYDAKLIDRVFDSAETLLLHGRQVRVPSIAHQLFLALARCEPWDADESFARLVEAKLLLLDHSAGVDWDELLHLIETYGLEAIAGAFLGDLQRYAGVDVSRTHLDRLAGALSLEKRDEWAIRCIAPEDRTTHQRWQLQACDLESGRSRPSIGVASAEEMALRERGLTARTAEHLWNYVRQRVGKRAVTEIVYAEGFTYPEREGRWTLGHWAVLLVPLTPAQQAGAPVHFRASAFLGPNGRARVAAYGGRRLSTRVQVRGEESTMLDLVLRPLPELGGAGLAIIWVPDAATPKAANMSEDGRELGLFVLRNWQSPHRRSAQSSTLARLRTAYRQLPLPIALRARLSPILHRLVTARGRGRIPLPLPAEQVAPGDVVVSGFLSDVSGIGRAGRLTRDSVASWHVPLITHDLRTDPDAGEVEDVGQGGVWICHCNPPEALVAMQGASTRLWVRRYRIGVWAYELPELPPDWVSALPYFHEIWAPSQFVANAILAARRGPMPIVRVVPHPLPPTTRAQPQGRAPGTPFTFLTMFDTRSTAARKNPFGAIDAFKQGFAPEATSVALRIKVVHESADGDAMRNLEAAIAGWPNVSLLRQHLSDDETLALIADADCLVSLHRSEGFGLTIAEAMSVGTPSIVTAWSAPIEFCAGAAVPIDYKLVPVVDDSLRYSNLGQRWAEPDVGQAAREMQSLAADPDRWMALSRAGVRLAGERLQQPIPSTDYRRFLTSWAPPYSRM